MLRYILSFILILLSFCIIFSSSIPSKVLVLIITVSQFEDHSINPLPSTEKDGKMIRDLFSSLDYDVKWIKNPTLARMKTAINEFIDRKGYDMKIFYYSGHGYKDDEGGYYLIPKDTDSRYIEDTAYKFNEAIERMEEDEGTRYVIIVDACYSGIMRGEKPLNEVVIGVEDIEEEVEKIGVMYLSSEEYEKSKEGIFTEVMVEGMEGEGDKDGDGYVESYELYEYVEKEVEERSGGKQHPEFAGDRYKDMVLVISRRTVYEEIVNKITGDYSKGKIGEEEKNRLTRIMDRWFKRGLGKSQKEVNKWIIKYRKSKMDFETFLELIKNVRINEPPTRPILVEPKEKEVRGGPTILRWESKDPEGDKLKYEICIWKKGEENRKECHHDIQNNYINYNLIWGEIYNLQIIVSDDKGNETKGDVWEIHVINKPTYKLTVECKESYSDKSVKDIEIFIDGNMKKTTFTDYLVEGKHTIKAQPEYEIKEGLKYKFLEWASPYYSSSPEIEVDLLKDTKAEFRVIKECYLDVETLGNGSVKGGERYYECGSFVELFAQRVWGWKFEGWKVDNRMIRVNPWGFKIEKPMKIYAIFDRNKPPKIKLLSPRNDERMESESTTVTLRWECDDPEGDDLEFDVLVGNDENSLEVIRRRLNNYKLKKDKSNNYEIELNLEYGKHYWQVIAYDADGGKTVSEIRSFELKMPNLPPSKPEYISPDYGAEVSGEEVTLKWECDDPNKDELKFDVYVGSDPNHLELKATVSATNFTLKNLDEGEYYWKIVARDEEEKTKGNIWKFKVIKPMTRKPIITFTSVPQLYRKIEEEDFQAISLGKLARNTKVGNSRLMSSSAQCEIKKEASGNKYLHIEDYAKHSTVKLENRFQKLSKGFIKMRIRLRKMKGHSSKCEFALENRDKTWTCIYRKEADEYRFKFRLMVISNKASLSVSTSRTEFKKIANLTLNAWHDLKIEFDLDSKDFSIYIDDSRIFKRKLNYIQAKYFDLFELFPNSKGLCLIDIDDVEVVKYEVR